MIANHLQNHTFLTFQAISPRDTADKKFQFNVHNAATGDRVGFMINTDMELAYDIDVGLLTGTSCSIGVDCTEASTKPLVELYSSNSTAFNVDFKAVYEKMIEFGYDNLEVVV